MEIFILLGIIGNLVTGGFIKLGGKGMRRRKF